MNRLRKFERLSFRRAACSSSSAAASKRAAWRTWRGPSRTLAGNPRSTSASVGGKKTRTKLNETDATQQGGSNSETCRASVSRAYLFVLQVDSFRNVLAVDELLVRELCHVTERLLARTCFLQRTPQLKFILHYSVSFLKEVHV